MAKRKTVSVEVMLNELNELLENSSREDLREFRKGLCVACEHILWNANSYGGYKDLGEPSDFRRRYYVKTW